MPVSTVNMDLMSLHRADARLLMPAIRVLTRMLVEDYVEDYVAAHCSPVGQCVEEPEREVWQVHMRTLADPGDDLEWKATVPRSGCGAVHFLDHLGRSWTVDH